MSKHTRTERILDSLSAQGMLAVARRHAKRGGSIVEYFAGIERTSVEAALISTMYRTRLVRVVQPAKTQSWRGRTHDHDGCGFALFLLAAARSAYPMWVDRVVTGRVNQDWNIDDRVRSTAPTPRQVDGASALYVATLREFETALIRIIRPEHADLRNACSGIFRLARVDLLDRQQIPDPKTATTQIGVYLREKTWEQTCGNYARAVVFPALGIEPAFVASYRPHAWDAFLHDLDGLPAQFTRKVYTCDPRALTTSWFIDKPCPDGWLHTEALTLWESESRGEIFGYAHVLRISLA